MPNPSPTQTTVNTPRSVEASSNALREDVDLSNIDVDELFKFE